jgi:hypothetical protein
MYLNSILKAEARRGGYTPIWLQVAIYETIVTKPNYISDEIHDGASYI